MVKDYWMNGVQVKIWKGKVEGECSEWQFVAAAPPHLRPCQRCRMAGLQLQQYATDACPSVGL